MSLGRNWYANAAHFLPIVETSQSSSVVLCLISDEQPLWLLRVQVTRPPLWACFV